MSEPVDGGVVEVLIQMLHPLAAIPVYARPGDAGTDLITTRSAVLPPGARAVLPTGVAIALPLGYAAFVHPRSGLAARIGLALVNAPGTIDAGYRGEIKVIAVNLDPHAEIRLEAGERIAQLVFQRVAQASFRLVDRLPQSARGTDGHGSTGGAAALETRLPR